MENRVTEFEQIMKDCTLCPRNCHADRLGGRRGYCGQGAEIMAARAALHFWEEPCISGETGSGTVFFSGCVLRCVYCQNQKHQNDFDYKADTPHTTGFFPQQSVQICFHFHGLSSCILQTLLLIKDTDRCYLPFFYSIFSQRKYPAIIMTKTG